MTAVESAAVKDMPGRPTAWHGPPISSGRDFDAASRWRRAAPLLIRPSLPAGSGSKLLLRDGKINDAAATSLAAVKAFPPRMISWLAAEGIFGDDPDQQTFRIYLAAAGDLALLQLEVRAIYRLRSICFARRFLDGRRVYRRAASSPLMNSKLMSIDISPPQSANSIQMPWM